MIYDYEADSSNDFLSPRDTVRSELEENHEVLSKAYRADLKRTQRHLGFAATAIGVGVLAAAKGNAELVAVSAAFASAFGGDAIHGMHINRDRMLDMVSMKGILAQDELENGLAADNFFHDEPPEQS